MKQLFLLLSITLLFTSCGSPSSKRERTAEAQSNAIHDEKIKSAAEDLSDHPGKVLYNQHCLPCHQADANGVPGMYPPLTGTKMVNGDKEELIGIVLFGLDEEIEVKGEIYHTVMAPLPYLSDKEVADVLTYVRQSFGNDASEVTPDEVAKVRASKES